MAKNYTKEARSAYGWTAFFGSLSALGFLIFGYDELGYVSICLLLIGVMQVLCILVEVLESMKRRN